MPDRTRYDSGITHIEYVKFVSWADVAEYFSAQAEGLVTEARAMLDRLNGQLDALLGAFETEGVAAAEGLAEWLEVSRGRLEAFVKGAAGYVVQYTMGLVRSYFLETDLDPVGDGIPPDFSVEDWEANHASVRDISKCIVGDLKL